jgi:hypothetical protein
MGAPYVGISMPSPVRDLGERLSLSVPSMEMRPEVAVAPAPTAVPAVKKCEITPPVREVATSVPISGPTETAAPKQSFWGRAKHFVERGFSNVGDFVAGEEPVILPTGKDYLMGDDIREKAAPMEAKAAAASAVLIATAVEAAGAGGAAGAVGVARAVGKVGTKVIARAIKSGDSVSSFARKADGMDLASKADKAGIGLKVKVPGEEYTSSTSSKMGSQGLGSEPTTKVLPKELAISNKINPVMRAEVENDCGVKMPENLVGYTKHGMDRALFKDEVGVSSQSILDTWNNPVKIKFEMDEYGGKFNIFGEKSMIAVNKNGEVITTRASTKQGYRITK